MVNSENDPIIAFIEQHGVRPTANRMLLVKALASAQGAVTLKQIEAMLPHMDKSSIFRTLVTFRDAGAVHTLEDGEGDTCYELCDRMDDDEHDDEHVHFYCVQCHKTTCLYDQPIPHIELPQGYQAHTTNFMMKGLCPECAAKARRASNKS